MTAVHAAVELSPQNMPVPGQGTSGDATGMPQADLSATAEQAPAPLLALNEPAPLNLGEVEGQDVAPVVAVPPEFPAEETPEDEIFEEAGEESEDGVVPVEGPKGSITYARRSEDSQLIFELVLEDKVTVFDPAFTAYQVDETVLVPLGKFAEAVAFPIAVDTGTGTASGWFLQPENTFQLSFPYNFVEIAGKKIPLNQQGIVETHLDDIYVSLDLLNSWFPIGLTLNYNELRLYIKPLTDLPVQERAKRHGRWEASQSGKKQPGLDYDPKDVIILPDRKFAAPSVQVSHNYGHSRDGAGVGMSSTSTSLSATAEMMGMNVDAGLGFQSSTVAREEIQNIRFTLSKKDYDGKLLGPLKATRYELGDVSSGTFSLASQGSGRGFTLTNQPYNFISDASNFRITGTGTPGWDVEVFQGTELLAFETVGNDGRYDFEALPLNEGFNLFKIILYGPNGEREERYDRFYLGQNMVPKGEFYYSASALQSLSPLLDVSATPTEETPPLLALTGEYGLSKNVSAQAGVFHGLLSNTMLDGVGLGLRSSGASTYMQVNGFVDKSGGQSASAVLTGNITPTSAFNIQHQRHRNYAPGVRTVARNTVARLTKIFDFKNEILPDINVALQAAEETAETGVVKRTYMNRLSTNFMGLVIANELEREAFSDASPDTSLGTLSLRLRTPLGLMHSDLNYNFYGPFEWKSGTFSLQNTLLENLTLTTGVNHSFAEGGTTSLSSALDWKLNKLRLGLNGQIDNNHNKQIGLSVAYSLMPRTLYGDYIFAEMSTDISSGRLLIRPFIDKNGNGLYDAGEPLVEGVRFHNVLRGSLSEEAIDGNVILAGLAPNLANKIEIDEKSVEDIYLTPAKKELIVLGKSGTNGPIDFAFNKLGDITGTLIKIGAEGEDIPLSDVQIILLGADGKQVADAYSESDGYFSFGSIPVGRYEIFFPTSETLAQYYTGDGQGPSLGVDFDNPELSDVRIIVEQDRIILEGQSAAPDSAAAAASGTL